MLPLKHLIPVLLGGLLVWGGWSSAVLAAHIERPLGPRDVLTVTVVDHQELSGSFPIDPDGTVTLPLLGRVTAAGLDAAVLAQRVRQLLAEGYLRNPQVSISVAPYNRSDETVSVLGEVRAAGSYPINRTMTLTEALARAGSTTARAGSVAIVTRPAVQSGVKAHPPALPQVIRVNLPDVQSGAAENVELRGGDTLYVPPAETIFVLGAVATPGAYAYQEQMTVLQALALGGGLTERGSTKRIKIIRLTTQGKPQEIKARLHDLLRPSDTVMVGERLF